MLFGTVIFLSAFLLFQAQLIVAKHLLPWFGGTPAVWTTCQMFFQVLLLGGYAYAHLLTRTRWPWLQYRVHVGLLLLATVSVAAGAVWGGDPILAPESMKPLGAESPVPLLLLILLVSVGLPFFAVSTTAPLLQRWHSRQSSSLEGTYRLYALSNAASFLALLSYPFGIERLLDLPQQARVWTAMFALFAVGCGVIAWRCARQSETAEMADDLRPPASSDSVASNVVRPANLTLWILLSFVGAATYLATTNQLTQDVAAVPLLWVLPLAIYLLSFVLCFDRPQWYSRRWTLIVAGVTSGVVMFTQLSIQLRVLTSCAFLFAFCVLCQGELERLKPGSRRLTLFYLLIAFGGALGGTFVGIGAPLLFRDLWEFQIVVVAGWFAVAFAWWLDRTSPFHTGDRWLFAWLVAVVLLVSVLFVESAAVTRASWILGHHWSIAFGVTAILAFSVCAAVWRSQFAQRAFWPYAAFLALMGLSIAPFLLHRSDSANQILYVARNFYGVLRITSNDDFPDPARRLLHGTTLHGVQVLGARRNTPTTYYSQSSGVGRAATVLLKRALDSADGSHGLHFGVVGMGVGTMSAYVRATDRIRFYEINPEIININRQPDPYFTFIRDCPGQIVTVPGDARLSLEHEVAEIGTQQFDLLVIDAFSSDSIPVHLLTIEAFRVFSAHLKTPDSILAIHVTNRHLDLEPVVAANARELGFHSVFVDSTGDPPAKSGSDWILLTRNPILLGHSALAAADRRPLTDRMVRFTDKHSSLYEVLK